MPTFCLVHGSTQGAAGWDRLAPELERRGHAVVRMDLPADQPEAGAAQYAQWIADAIPADRDPVTVVAHSAGGLFLPLVPSRRKVCRLVYLAAVVPSIGESLMDQVRRDKGMFNPDWPGKDPTKDEQLARHFLFHDCAPEVARWALGTLRLMFARAAAREPTPLLDWPAVPSSYIVCAEDRTIQPAWSRRIARERLGVEAIELPGGHCPHVSRPGELAGILDRLN